MPIDIVIIVQNGIVQTVNSSIAIDRVAVINYDKSDTLLDGDYCSITEPYHNDDPKFTDHVFRKYNKDKEQ